MAVTSVLKILDSLRGSYVATRTVGDVQLWREESGEVFYRVGNSIVLAKVRWRGEWRAMRCYMRSVPHLAEIYGDKYFAEELYVWSSSHSGQWIDVVMEEWVDGVTLRQSVESAIERGDTTTLRRLADSFDSMASELLSSDSSHGDLTADNILVTTEGQLRLIDFDCKFLPQFSGDISPELGTAAFQPPVRQIEDFDKDIDDYSIALISTALRALSIEPSLYHKFKFYDGLLFDPQLVAQGKCTALAEVSELFIVRNLAAPYRVAQLLGQSTLRIPLLRDIFCVNIASSQMELQLFMQNGLVGYSTLAGEVVIPPVYEDGLSCSEGIMMVKFSGQWLAINHKNETLMSFEGCQRVKSLKDGVVWVERDGVWSQFSF